MKANYRAAIHDAIADAMREDERVVLLGEDVPGDTAGPTRCRRVCWRSSARTASATPRSQSWASSASGSARHWAVRRPIVEVMTVNFSLLALDQIVNTASALRHMSNGQFSVPIVVRMARRGTAAGRPTLTQPGELVRPYPGITVLAPATVADAYGMLRTALTNPIRRSSSNMPRSTTSPPTSRALVATDIAKAAVRRMPAPTPR